jgi:hypothetical protein
MPPGKKGQASSLGQNKVHFHKYNLILLPPDTISSHSSEERGLLWKHRLSQARTSYSCEDSRTNTKNVGKNTSHENREYLF